VDGVVAASMSALCASCGKDTMISVAGSTAALFAGATSVRAVAAEAGGRENGGGFCGGDVLPAATSAGADAFSADAGAIAMPPTALSPAPCATSGPSCVGTDSRSCAEEDGAASAPLNAASNRANALSLPVSSPGVAGMGFGVASAVAVRETMFMHTHLLSEEL
jgi:hypothetical protein